MTGDEGEVAMFEMINEEKPDADARKMFWIKVGAFIVALAGMTGLIYFFAFVH